MATLDELAKSKAPAVEQPNVGEKLLNVIAPKEGSAIPLFSLLGGVRNAFNAPDAAAQKQALVKQIAQQVQAGDYQGAVSTTMKLDPTVGMDLLKQMKELDPDLAAKLQPVKFSDFQDEKGSYILNEKTGKAELIPGSGGKKDKEKFTELGGDTKQRLSDAMQSLGDINTLNDLGMKFVQQDKSGLFSGSMEQIKNFIGAADPTSTQFQGMRELVALSLAAQANKGRPTDADRAAAEKLLAKERLDPVTFRNQLQLGTAKLQTEAARSFLFEAEATQDPNKQAVIKAIAQQNGINLEYEQKLNSFARQSKKNPVLLRKDMLAIKSLSPQNIKLYTPKEKERLVKIAQELEAAGLLTQ